MACEALDGPLPRAIRPAAVCALAYFSFRVSRVSRHLDSRGARTCDPQTPPSVSLDRLPLLQKCTIHLDKDSRRDGNPIGLLQNCYNRQSRLPSEMKPDCLGREQEMGPLCF